MGARPVDDEILQVFAGHTELRAVRLLRSDLKGDRPRLVHEHAIAAIRQVKWHRLIGLIAACAAILVPVLHNLAIFDECSEAFAKSINALAHAQRKLLKNKVSPILPLRIPHVAPAALCQHLAAGLE